MSRTTILLVMAGAALLAASQGCSSDSESSSKSSTSTTATSTTATTGAGGAGGSGSTTSAGGGTTTSTTGAGGAGGGGAFPAPPALGAQIDRMGRPAINTAANHTFDADMAKKDAAKDAWNMAADPSQWASFAPDVASSIAILDGLDTNCGNQLLAGPQPQAGRYDTLAGVLADDRLWVKTDAATCSTYLAVEANAVGVIPNADCGGRKLSYDVVDESYSVLAAGAVSGVTDGVAPDADTKGDTFPYLAGPH